MIEPFVYNASPAHVVFGQGTIQQVGAEAERLGARRVLVLTTPQQIDHGERVLALLGGKGAGLFSQAAMHTPVNVTNSAVKSAQNVEADCVLAIGGGSTTGLGKAIALRTDLPQIVVPTTYAGSEMTSILGQTEDGIKTTLNDSAVLPETVVYDVDLTLTLPAALSGTSGINAIAHAVEALYAQNKNPILSLMAVRGIAALADGLPRIVQHPDDVEARTDALFGAWLCAICLGSSGVALHHKLCHVLGGSFDLPHAETHTIVLPHALSYNAPAVPDAMEALSSALNSDNPTGALYDLAVSVGANTALRDIGMPEAGIDRAVDISLQTPYWNPRPLDGDGIRALLLDAWAGNRPLFR